MARCPSVLYNRCTFVPDRDHQVVDGAGLVGVRCKMARRPNLAQIPHASIWWSGYPFFNDPLGFPSGDLANTIISCLHYKDAGC